MMVYGIIFKDNGKIYYFKSDLDIKLGEPVIVETEKGLQYGKVDRLINKDNINLNDLKNIIRISTDEDNKKYYDNLKDSEKALRNCKKIVNELSLNMNVISASFTFDRSQLLFNFISDERIDFRELAKRLAGIYHTRIELRQIGARDKAREIGGVGVCGQKICCQKFLHQIDAVSMNMAKNQNLALNPSKINGVCGRLLCCLSYEDSEYLECSKGLPELQTEIETKKGKGKVVNVDILNRKVKVLVDGNKEEIEF
jgi:cell fate regulator YaaT (PSP1 superfamily)